MTNRYKVLWHYATHGRDYELKSAEVMAESEQDAEAIVRRENLASITVVSVKRA